MRLQGEAPGLGLDTEQRLREEHAAGPDLLVERAVLARVHDVEPVGHHADRPRAALQRSVVRGGVDAEGQARDDVYALGGEIASQLAGQVSPVSCAAPGPDDRDIQPAERGGSPDRNRTAGRSGSSTSTLG